MRELEQKQTEIYRKLVTLTVNSKITWKISHSAWFTTGYSWSVFVFKYPRRVQVTIDGETSNFDPFGYELENLLEEKYPIEDKDLTLLDNVLKLLEVTEIHERP